MYVNNSDLKPLFDAIVSRAQTLKRATRMTKEGRVCAYRQDLQDEGLACFIGELIPDEYYTPELEELDPCSSEIMQLIGLSRDNMRHRMFVRWVRGIHDFEDESTWAKSLAKLRIAFGLRRR